MKIEILGAGCPKCKQLAAQVDAALRELAIQAEVNKVTQIDKIIEYGVLVTPALVIDGRVAAAGKVLNKEELKRLFTIKG